MTLPCPDIAFECNSDGTLRTSPDGNPSRRQALKPGVSASVQYALEWTNRRATDAAAIQSQFDATGAHGSFSFTPPGGSAGLYKFAGSPSITSVGVNRYQIRATVRLARGIHA